MVRLFLVHKGRDLTAKAISVISAALPSDIEIGASPEDADACVIGDDLWDRRGLLEAYTQGKPLYRHSHITDHIRTRVPLAPPEQAVKVPKRLKRPRSHSPEITQQQDSPVPAEPMAEAVSSTPPAQIKDVQKMLDDFIEIYDLLDEPFRAKFYKRASNWIRRHPNEDPLTASDQSISPSVKQKIREFIRTGASSRLDALRHSDPKLDCKKELTKIFGVGMAQATKWVNAGICTPDELREAVARGDITLDHRQTIGLEYLEEFEQRISRAEVEDMGRIVEHTALHMLGMRVDMTICGSYRRGAATCGDADIILVSQDPEKSLGIHRLVARLQELNFVTAVLQLSTSPDLIQTFLGVCLISNEMSADLLAVVKEVPQSPYHRRIDIKLYPAHTRPFALIQWTGGEQFLRTMKMRATAQGYRLSDKGLFPIASVTKEKLGPSVRLKTEREVFEFLGLPYR